jgi:hypothetical protein
MLLKELLELGAPWAMSIILLWLLDQTRKKADAAAKDLYALGMAVVEAMTKADAEKNAFRRELELMRDTTRGHKQ